MKKKILIFVIAFCLALTLFPTGALADPVEQTVSLLTISDPIAPITGNAPVTAIDETVEYTGSVSWAHGEGEFAAGITYTATITLTVKDGYTFEGVVENAFSVPCAKSATNEADSGVIIATFLAPPEGYITDGYGVMAYRYTAMRFDMMGFFYNAWKQTTFWNNGFYTEYKIGDAALSYVDITGDPVDLGDTGLTMDVDLEFVSGGRALRVVYTIENNNTGSISGLSFGSHADVMIGHDDSAEITVFDTGISAADNRGFKMVSDDTNDRKPIGGDGYEYPQFNFFGKNSVGVTNVDTFWFGGYGARRDNLFEQVTDTSYSSDSGMAYSWKNRTIGAGQSQVYSVIIGIGGAGSADVLGYSVAYNDNVPDETIDVPETQEKLENVALTLSGETPVRSGYIFNGWNTQSDGEGMDYAPGDIYTANESVVLYAMWTGGLPVWNTYFVTAKAEGEGSISPSGTVGFLEGVDRVFVITPAPGYIISDVLVDGVSVGAVETYTLKNISKDYKITAVFVREPWENPYIDVNEGDWFYDSIMHMSQNGLMAGTGANTFSPHMDATRAMIAAILYRMEGSPDVDGENIFYDVLADIWYSDALLWAERGGVVLGVAEGQFDPDSYITRQELAAMLYRYAKYKGYDVSASGDLSVFSDEGAVSPWALEAVKWAVGAQLLVGRDGGILDPQGPATRAEAAAVVVRFMEKYNSL